MNEIYIYSNKCVEKREKYTIQSFKEKYSKIRVYHACRVIEFDSYLKNGIMPLSKQQSLNILMSLNLNITNDKLLNVFNQEWNFQESFHNKVWVSLSKEELLNHSGHYLVYGSEFILGIAVKLGLKEKLKSIGMPTIFSCDIKTDKISNGFIKSVIDAINEGTSTDIAFSIEGHIENEEINHYENPVKIFDPIDWKYYFYNE